LAVETRFSSNDKRAIILAPTGKDALLIQQLFERSGFPAIAVDSVAELCEEIGRGAGAALISEEALGGSGIGCIVSVLRDQPSWSDFPLILLTVAGRVTLESERLRQLRRPLGNVFLVERPIRPETLLSTLEIALRGRERQYQIRNQMEQFAKAQEALLKAEKLAVTGRLATSIAHEINNPLEAVTNLLFLMRHEPNQEMQVAYLQQAEQELARVSEIVKQTLRFYKATDRRAEINVASVVESVLALYQSRLQYAGITVETEVLVPSASVLSSAGELKQILANLIGNAIDAMRSGGKLRIRISPEQACRTDGMPGVRLTVADTGSGISKELLPTIFEPFVTTKGEMGTGLGLWVTDEIVKRNGWRINVRSSVTPKHRGTAISLQMPVAKEQQEVTAA
jgi:signal transduction histidine kinase